jgi:FkbM family methyltransferase
LQAATRSRSPGALALLVRTARRTASPLAARVRVHHLLHPLAKLRLAADAQSARRLLELAAHSPLLRPRPPQPATRPLRIRLRPLGGRAVLLRPYSSDYDVLLDTFLSRYHLEPLRSAPDTILDLGANVGLTIAHYASLYPQARIVGVELDAHNFELCRENIAPFGERCRVVHGAIWAEEGEITYRRQSGNEWGFAIGGGDGQRGDSDPRGEEVSAPALTIDSLLARVGWSRVDFVKMDIEGAEREVLRGGESWSERVASIGVEVHFPYTVQECERDLQRLGFSTARLLRHRNAVLGQRSRHGPSAGAVERSA